MMELKPCPFCGSIKQEIYARGDYIEDSGGCYYASSRIECSCGFALKRCHLKDAIRIWNRRPIEDKQAEQIATLKEEKAGVERTANAVLSFLVKNFPVAAIAVTEALEDYTEEALKGGE